MKATKAQGQRKTKIIVVINQKGGQGKTAVSFNLAHAAIKDETSRVLCLDLDSQGNLSQTLSGDLAIVERTEGGVGDLFEGNVPQPDKSIHPQIDLMHGHMELERYDKVPDYENRAYEETPALLRSLGYDVIVIDTPPAAGLRQLAPLIWADLAVIPMEPSMYGISGFQMVLSAIDKTVRKYNPTLRWLGLVNRVNLRKKGHREKDEWLHATYGENILATVADRAAVADAVEESQAVWDYRASPRQLRENWKKWCNAVIDL